MQSAFVWESAGTSPAGTTRRHITGGVTVTAEPDGEGYTVLTPTGSERVVDVRGVWLALEVETTALGGLGGAAGGEGLSLGRVWLELMSGTRLRYIPDASVPTIALPVVPDLADRATLLLVTSGTIAPGTTGLKLRSRLRYAPADPVLVAMAAASPYSPLDL